MQRLSYFGPRIKASTRILAFAALAGSLLLALPLPISVAQDASRQIVRAGGQIVIVETGLTPLSPAEAIAEVERALSRPLVRSVSIEDLDPESPDMERVSDGSAALSIWNGDAGTVLLVDGEIGGDLQAVFRRLLPKSDWSRPDRFQYGFTFSAEPAFAGASGKSFAGSVLALSRGLSPPQEVDPGFGTEPAQAIFDIALPPTFSQVSSTVVEMDGGISYVQVFRTTLDFDSAQAAMEDALTVAGFRFEIQRWGENVSLTGTRGNEAASAMLMREAEDPTSVGAVLTGQRFAEPSGGDDQ